MWCVSKLLLNEKGVGGHLYVYRGRNVNRKCFQDRFTANATQSFLHQGYLSAKAEYVSGAPLI